ncbi:uncharacterized protein [Hemitrygon akajei]|uniref:uncharacterized protein n=1 Tax=Hemitrygon akajei TaxID=2704970 RepID=UPI003BF9DD09
MLPVFLLVASLTSVEGLSKGRCLGYDVLCTTADYEFRRYKESVWVGINASKFHVAVVDMVPLHYYFSLENSEGMKIQLTGQLLVSLSGIRVLAIYLMLPEELWDNPPTPTNPRLFVTRFPMMDVFARFIRGFLFTDAGDFNRTLTEQNVHVNNSNFFVYSCLGERVAFSSLLHGFLRNTTGHRPPSEISSTCYHTLFSVVRRYGSFPLADSTARPREANEDALDPPLASC